MLYREWFVHFRFPGHEHVKIIDGLPEGWERRTLRCVEVNPSTLATATMNSRRSRWRSLVRSRDDPLIVQPFELSRASQQGPISRMATRCLRAITVPDDRQHRHTLIFCKMASRFWIDGSLSLSADEGVKPYFVYLTSSEIRSDERIKAA